MSPDGRRPTLPTDFRSLFMGTPSALVATDADTLVIVAANDAYCALTGRDRDELVGTAVFEAFPGEGGGSEESQPLLSAALRAAADTGTAQTMPLLRYDLEDSRGEFAERYWTIVIVPIPAADGSPGWVLQRVEDVTDFISQQVAHGVEPAAIETGTSFFDAARADFYGRTRELEAAWRAEAIASRRLAAIADVARRLSQAKSVEALAEIVIARGLGALEPAGGVIGVIAAQSLTLIMDEASRRRLGTDVVEIALDEPMPMTVAAVTGTRILLPDAAAARSWSPQMDVVLEYTTFQAFATMPLQGRAGLLGSLTVGWKEPRSFTEADIELLDALAAQCATGLQRILDEQRERESALAVRRMSETMQRSLLTEPQQPDHLQVEVRYKPAAKEAQIGGDWYDSFLTSDGATCLVIADVAGHDFNAAAAMGQLRNLLRGIAYGVDHPPAEILSTLDRAMRDLEVPSLATAVLVKVEQDEQQRALGLRSLRWTNAGHPPPVLIHQDGSAELLAPQADLLLGLDPQTDRADHVRPLLPGDTVLLYTDGLVERRDANLDDGLAWLLEAVTAHSAAPLATLCDWLLDQLPADAEDDVALLALRAHPEDRPRPPDAGPAHVPPDFGDEDHRPA